MSADAPSRRYVAGSKRTIDMRVGGGSVGVETAARPGEKTSRSVPLAEAGHTDADRDYPHVMRARAPIASGAMVPGGVDHSIKVPRGKARRSGAITCTAIGGHPRNLKNWMSIESTIDIDHALTLTAPTSAIGDLHAAVDLDGLVHGVRILRVVGDCIFPDVIAGAISIRVAEQIAHRYA
ncbi:hypothetical protein [Burkholderia cepacia]|uniref:hypothetical protein n=1 Tax=Burkholderia cepacia TaxID=292 RepID=UPI002AB7F18E|nr:hypothetical protein [Burkholderia cepacia]